MRVPNISNYVNATFRLGTLTSDLQDANEVVTTQKQLNEISDNPIGLSQVLSLKDTLGNLAQIEANVIVGKSWIESIENAMDSVNELILSAKVDITRLANDSTSADERRDAIERIDSYIEQILSLGNTQVNGSYIFGGEDINVIPFEYDRIANRVIYNGNQEAFEIRSDKQAEVSVGRNGEDTFWDEEIHINTTNDTIIFTEDNGHGITSERFLKTVIPDGFYSKSGLATTIQNQLNAESEENGYGLTYEVEYNADTNRFAIREDGSYPGYIKTEFLWESGPDARISGVNVSNEIDGADINISVINPEALTIETPEPKGTEPFRLVWTGDNTWEIENNPGYLIVPSIIPGTSSSIEIDLDDSGTPDIRISLDKPVDSPGEYVEFEINPVGYDQSIGHEIGFAFEDTTFEPLLSDTRAEYVTDLIIVDGTNDQIVFEEVSPTGLSATLTADINATGVDAVYTDMDDLAQAIETQMEAVSAFGINYAVTYDAATSRFNIREDGTQLNELNVLWSNSPAFQATARTLGYYPFDDNITYPSSDTVTQSNITLDETNNVIYFRETGAVTRSLSAVVPTGTYTNMADLENALETAMNDASAASGNSVLYDFTYNPVSEQFEVQRVGGGALAGLDMMWASGTSPDGDRSIGPTLGFISNDTGSGIGFPYVSETPPVLMRFDQSNNAIDFREVSIDGDYSEDLSIRIPEGEYTSLDDVAAEIQKALRDESPYGVPYTVDYDYAAGAFTIRGSDANIKSFELLWKTGVNREESAASMLGFLSNDRVRFSESDESVVNLTIDATNNKIDFREYTGDDLGMEVDQLTAVITEKVYTNHDELAREVEKALEAESRINGHGIDYSVTWDEDTQRFSIKENGTTLEQLDLMWQSGDNAPLSAGGTGESIGPLLGFNTLDDTEIPMESTRDADWGIFNTLIDLKDYLADNDRDGIERSIGRLEQNFDLMTSRIVDAGMKFSRLEVRETITTEVGLSLTERKSMIEDADIIESIMKLQNVETAYQAALSSTSRILNLSLVDYL